MEVEFVASVSAIVSGSETRQLLTEGIGIGFEGGEGDYVFTERLPGVKHFGVWPLEEAARACFSKDTWPEDVPLPQASIEFEVADVASAAAELRAKGFQLLHDAKTEPWGQTTARLLTPEGLVIAVCHTPWFHEDAED